MYYIRHVYHFGDASLRQARSQKQMALAEMKLRKLKEEALTSWTDNPREKLFGGAVQHAGLLAGDDPRALETEVEQSIEKAGHPSVMM